MPYLSEKIKIEGTSKDRRIKLTNSQKKFVKLSYEIGIPIRQIARIYGVDKRLIQFILFPERQERNIKLRKERGGSKQYYTKEKNTEAVKGTRNYKQKLFLNKQIFLNQHKTLDSLGKVFTKTRTGEKCFYSELSYHENNDL